MNIRYYTKDTALASWLYMNGISLENITSEKTAQIVFKGDEQDIQNLVEQFQSGNPHGNIISFFRSYKDIVSRIKVR